MKLKSYRLMRQPSFKQSERGVALIVALLLLVVIALTGIASMRTTIQQERMSGNSVDRALAMQASESAMREARQLIQDANGSLPAWAVNCTIALGTCPADPNASANGVAGVNWRDVTTAYQPSPGTFANYQGQYSGQFLGWYTAAAATSLDPNPRPTEVIWLYRINGRSFNPVVTQNRAFVATQTVAEVRTALD